MNNTTMRPNHFRLGALTLILLGMAGLLLPAAPAQSGESVGDNYGGFQMTAPQGFGDRQNSWAWSMIWWREHLYVGTNRAFFCAETAAISRFIPPTSNLFPYPPRDPDVTCTRRPEELPLRAEIWRWSAQTRQWTRVYQSPEDLAIPGRPLGDFVARDVGFRGMTIYTEANGEEALYVTGVSSRFLGYDVPPPRILRSTDGLTFAPVPQRPGTLLGDQKVTSLRNPIVFDGKLYIVGGSLNGAGLLLESASPAAGDDSYRVVSPPELSVSAVQSFNGHLYIGVFDGKAGYGIYKARPGSVAPYQFTPVIINGGHAVENRNSEILSMVEFKGQLYAGGNGVKAGFSGIGGPAELVRINPDDSWEVVVGIARDTPTGVKRPTSGYNSGFNNYFNSHMWRMAVFEDQLYVGTFDSATLFREYGLSNDLRLSMGADLYRTKDGARFELLTNNGFCDLFNFGIRTIEPTPYGLFVGTANYYYGTQIWRLPRIGTAPTPPLFMPMINK